MPFRLSYRSTYSPAEVLGAIGEHAGYWQESLTPESLRRRGLYRVIAEIKPPQFRLLAPSNRRPHPSWYDVTGYVLPLPGGGSHIEAKVHLAKGFAVGPILFALVGLSVLRTQTGAALVVIAMAVGSALLYFGYDRNIRPGKDEATDHLLARLDHAMTFVNAEREGALLRPSNEELKPTASPSSLVK